MATRSIVTKSDLANNLILLATVLAVILYIARPSPEMRKGSDFAEIYAAAQMVRHGRSHQLYDPETQYQFQSRYLGRVGSYYLHAPFELVPYLLLTGLSLQRAFLFLSLCNGVVLLITARVFSRHLLPDLNWRLLTGLFLLFVPVLLNFLQGQDSLVLLLILTLVLVEIRAKKEFSAGCLLACGLFKFHLILPLVFILGFSSIRKSKFFAGFVLMAVLLTIVSLMVCGWEGFSSYPRLLLQLNDLPFAGVNPREMANFRGLFALLFSGHSFAALNGNRCQLYFAALDCNCWMVEGFGI
ncbi:MAG TPA: glycosyltransferase family 87 protein [Terriglobales bacterium]|nr:glycosyltransferase family 87 protein [Terriglobales bacterium]